MKRKSQLPAVARLCVFAAALCIAAGCTGAQPIIDNERVTVWEVTSTKEEPSPIPLHSRDFVTLYLAGATDGAHKRGDVVFAHRGVSTLNPGERTVVIELKDHP